MKKRILALLFLFQMLTALFHLETKAYKNTLSLNTPVCITLNGSYLKTEHPAYLENGYTLVPLRTLSEALSADYVEWDAASQTARIQKKNTEISVTKDKKTAKVNGKTVALDAAACIYKDRFYIPLRFISETFGVTVNWDKNTYTAQLTANNISVPEALKGKKPYEEDDIYWLSRIVHAESRGEPMEGKIGVANVVLNRVESELFDNTIYGVIFDKKHGVQFTPILNGTIYQTPLGDSIIAAKRALLGENTVGKSLYFLNPVIAESFWIVNNRQFYKSIGNHDFYL